MAKLRVGIIGAGNIATSAHLPAYAQLTDIVEVVAIADIVPERAKDAAEKYGIPHYYASVEELIAGEPDVDYIDVCTWTAAHAPVAIAAAKAGKNILCEKPLAATLEQGLAIEAAVKEAGVQFMLAVVTRYGAEQQKFVELRDAGKFGEIFDQAMLEQFPGAAYEVAHEDDDGMLDLEWFVDAGWLRAWKMFKNKPNARGMETFSRFASLDYV